MRALIGGWREVWGQGEFPFYYVQLAPFDYTWGGLAALAGYDVKSHYLPEIWEAQSAILAKTNTGMVVTNESARSGISPEEQAGGRPPALPLGRRQDLRPCGAGIIRGPLYRSLEVVDDTILVHFDHADGLTTRDGQPPFWFEIAGQDQEYVAATAV